MFQMHCPRLDHFVRLNHDGTVGRCGHMVDAPKFENLDQLDNSNWLNEVKQQFEKNQWPKECVRCNQTENLGQGSIRLNTINFDQLQTHPDYLIVGGVLDNVCNSACLTCNEHLSTKIGSLKNKYYPIVDNSVRFWNLPQERIVHLDINGGEPSASKNYKKLLANLPKNVKSVRVNTNGSLIIDELQDLAAAGIKVTVTVSLDGIGPVHDWVRWPIKWDKFYSNLMKYQLMPGIDLNTWTTVSALNIGDFQNIQNFISQHNLQHSYALLDTPKVLNVKYKNSLTQPYDAVFPGHVAIDKNNQHELDEFLHEQQQLRS
jgi:sulfatase maturation enzyme AslB (radical SAM superfamily)